MVCGVAEPDETSPVTECADHGAAECGELARRGIRRVRSQPIPVLRRPEGAVDLRPVAGWPGEPRGCGRSSVGLADQAPGSFLKPMEMHNPSKDSVVLGVSTSHWADLSKKMWHPTV
jgi:hypothetical protein